ncbi:MAG: hypothetical protein CO156_01835 [Candidatus Pacebacteria bacterium CG_4_9_14_3_um_filter_40_12]|nr:MAG: hypothetical protein COU64_04680 [Candidatus Pacebacteria bacterium CG10_big_fil_rev_8_21_14_0_10_40_26]PIZ79604.1 MAG: hypothetical protein COY01_00585 [Candidatus Pacebacteria bacterium CG_4_10_14_0_2_um_filter_40_20]PJA69057.1 MAG: hypothetical protein CO156_01835 [Candidatus Pacebacteria bacterium CG_4_9_14_3_um_filter_40_12]PJC41810.1 MAG: hypothetical protein CO041_03770 [Candidatus Pacebacteria bacterium CG_4_9_14_0_2_um_filter_40_15]
MFGMFHSARMKLTIWYLFTIMAISLLFSTALYFSFTVELERSFARAKVRVLAEEHGIALPPHWRQQLDTLDDPRLQHIVKSQLLTEDLQVAKESVIWQLFSINAILALFAIFAGWLLAGKTLGPIQKALEDQKKFVADASHELRTPVTALKILLEVFLLKKKHSETEVSEVVETSLEQVDNLQYLVDKLLRLTMYQGNRHRITFSTFEVKPLVQKVVTLLKPLADEKELDLEVLGAGVQLQADKEKIQELLTILVENAIKYTASGSVHVILKTSRRRCILMIKDTGEGISSSELPCIFNRFYRVDTARTQQYKAGFGLGLAVAKEIVETHGGSISVSSTLGTGSTFTVSLPLTQK